ncbi:MAG: hypothetical protein K2X86_07390 [Cytophagaceae bacterium]|nr:hypothetical protein [Cytophagaceae bacterium]
MNWIIKYKWILAGVIVGGIAGFLYWNFIGCSSSQCSITSVWYRSTLYGSMMGGLLASSISSSKAKN